MKKRKVMEISVGKGRLLCTVTEDVYEGLLVIPDSAKEAMKSSYATIVQTGSGVEGKKKGDIVHYGKFAGAEVEVDGETYFVIADEEVLLTVSGS